jgi:hypothetical protein
LDTDDRTRPGRYAAPLTDSRLVASLDGLGEAVERAVRGYRDDVVAPMVDGLSGLLGEWLANMRMQLDYLATHLASASDSGARRSESERARRDHARWMRRRLERTDALIRGRVPADAHTRWSEQLLDSVHGLPTVSAPFDAAAVAAEPARGLSRRWKHWRASRRGSRPRAIPLAAIAATRLYPVIIGEQRRGMRDAEAMRALFWRRFRVLILDSDALWVAAGERLGAGESVDWSAFARELADAVFAIDTELSQFAQDIRKHLEGALESVARHIRRDARLCDTPLLPVSEFQRPHRVAEGERERVFEEARHWETLAAGLAAECAAVLDGLAYVAALAYARHRDASALGSVLREDLLAALPDCGGNRGREAFCEEALRWLDDGERQSELLERVDAVLQEFDRSTRRAGERVAYQVDVVPASVVRITDHEAPPSVAPRKLGLRALADSMLAAPHRALLASVSRDAEALLVDASEVTADLVRIAEVRASEPQDTEWREAFALRTSEHRDQVAVRIEALVARFRQGVPEQEAAFVAQLAHLEQKRGPAVPALPAQGVTAQRSRERAPTVLPSRIVDEDDLLELMQRLTLRRHINRGVSRGYWQLVGDPGPDALSRDIGLQDELQRVARSLRAWEDGDPEAIAVVGPPGAGKSLLLYRVARETMRDYAVSRVSLDPSCRQQAGLVRALSGALDMPNCETLDDFVRGIRQTDERRVLFVEGGHRSFLRHVRGLEGIRALLHLITHTADQILWIVTFEALAYEFLAGVLHLTEAFTRVVELRPLQRDDLERFILARHRPSELGLEFARQSGESSADAQRRYFDALAEATGGHPPLALYCWLMSLVEQDGAIRVVAMPPILSRLLAPLDAERGVALATLMLHGAMSVPDFAAAMRMPRDEAASLLAALRHLHLAERTESGEVWVGEVRYAPLAADLRTRGVL